MSGGMERSLSDSPVLHTSGRKRFSGPTRTDRAGEPSEEEPLSVLLRRAAEYEGAQDEQELARGSWPRTASNLPLPPSPVSLTPPGPAVGRSPRPQVPSPFRTHSSSSATSSLLSRKDSGSSEDTRRGSTLFGLRRPNVLRSPTILSRSTSSPTPITLPTPPATLHRRSTDLGEPFSSAAGLGIDPGDDSDEEVRLPVRRGNKAALLLGLDPQAAMPTSPTSSPSTPTSTTTRSTSSTAVNATLPIFPCWSGDLVGWRRDALQIDTLASISTSFKRRRWRTRHVVLTSSATSAALHSFKSKSITTRGLTEETEAGRLELTKTTSVYIPADQQSRTCVLNVTGIMVTVESGAVKRVAASAMLGFENIGQLKTWMALLKGAVVELSGVAGEDVVSRRLSDAFEPRSAVRSSTSSNSPSVSAESTGAGFDGDTEKSWDTDLALKRLSHEMGNQYRRSLTASSIISRRSSAHSASSLSRRMPPSLPPPTAALPDTPPVSATLFDSFPSPPSRLARLPSVPSMGTASLRTSSNRTSTVSLPASDAGPSSPLTSSRARPHSMMPPPQAALPALPPLPSQPPFSALPPLPSLAPAASPPLTTSPISPPLSSPPLQPPLVTRPSKSALRPQSHALPPRNQLPNSPPPPSHPSPGMPLPSSLSGTASGSV